MQNEKVLVLDFGGQYNQLIARRVRECHVYCEVKSYKTTMEEIRAFDPVGIIFTGGPNSVYEEGSPQVSPEIFTMGVPILGICGGYQMLGESVSDPTSLVRCVSFDDVNGDGMSTGTGTVGEIICE